MKNTVFFILFILISATTSSVNGQCQVLLWQDEFESDTLNTEKWNVELDNSGGGNNELQFYTPRDTNVFVQEGKLVIRALEEEFGNRNYTSAKIITRGIADWSYGRVEAKIRLPQGQGMWPAFWVMPAENVYGGWPASGEIDIMEMVGLDPSTVHGTGQINSKHENFRQIVISK
ncbi:MAG: glycoside hydrolase family 16 protein [Bacteroidota bacterium]